jgi:hypothetical protein
MAWSVLSAAIKVCHNIEYHNHLTSAVVCFVKIVVAQRDRDENIRRLLLALDDVYSFISEVETLKKIESHREVIARLMKQTTICAHFISSYAEKKNFCMMFLRISEDQHFHHYLFLSGIRMGTHLVSNADDTIKEFQAVFSQLKAEFQGRAVVHIEISAMRILDNVESIGACFVCCG